MATKTIQIGIAIILIASTVTLVSAQPQGNWTKVDSIFRKPEFFGEYTIYFTNMACADSNHCMLSANAGGEYNFIRATSDGGRSWSNYIIDTIYISPVTAMHRRIVYPTPNLCITIRDSGYISRTTDGGSTWNTRKISPKYALNAISMYDSNRGVIGAAINVIYRTDDGGNTWREIPVPDSVNFSVHSIAMPAPRTICMVKYNVYWHLYRSDDDGITWKESLLPTRMYRMQFIDSLIGWYVWAEPLGDGTGWQKDVIYRTDDGGATWQRQLYDTIPNTYGPNCLAFVDHQTGFAGGGLGKLFGTTDGGKNWKYMDFNLYIDFGFNTLCFPSLNRAFACSTLGNIFRWDATVSSVASESKKTVTPLLTVTPNTVSNSAQAVLQFVLTSPGMVNLQISDVAGYQVYSEPAVSLERGSYHRELGKCNLASGTYFVSIAVNGKLVGSTRLVVAAAR